MYAKITAKQELLAWALLAAHARASLLQAKTVVMDRGGLSKLGDSQDPPVSHYLPCSDKVGL